MLQDVYALSVVGLSLDMVGIDERVINGLVAAFPFAPTMESDQVRAAIGWLSVRQMPLGRFLCEFHWRFSNATMQLGSICNAALPLCPYYGERPGRCRSLVLSLRIPDPSHAMFVCIPDVAL